MSTATATRPPLTAAARPLRAIRALVFRGLRDNRRSTLAWGVGLGIMSAFEVALFPSMKDSIGQALDGYPAGVKEAFGITDLATVESFMHAEMFSLVLPFALAYVAMRRIATAIAGAEENGYFDSVLAAPVARRTVVAAAFATAAIVSAGVLLVIGALTAVTGVVAGDAIAPGRLVAGLAGVWALALFFAGCTTAAAGLVHRAGVVMGATGGLLGAMYLFDVVGKLSEPVADLRWLSAFRYYGTPLQSGLDPAGFAVLIVGAALLAAAGASRFERRDVTG